ncbi:MAG TPA: hypothetical protein PLZ55_17365 [bacterium]|nr:hypothetical protein [bacterium]
MEKKWDLAFSAPEQQTSSDQAVGFLNCKEDVGGSLLKDWSQVGIIMEYGVAGEADGFYECAEGFAAVRDVRLLAGESLSPVLGDKERDVPVGAVQEFERFPVFRKPAWVLSE